MNIGKPCAEKPYARFYEGEEGDTCSLLYPLRGSLLDPDSHNNVYNLPGLYIVTAEVGDFQPKDYNFMLEQKLLDEIVVRLQKIHPLQIFLFGSQTSGMADVESDVDLLVVKENVVSSIMEMNEARKLLRGLGKPFDVIVSTPEEFDFYRNQVNSVHHAAAHYGRLLYG